MPSPPPDDWSRLQALAETVLQHPESERAAVLQAACSNDPDVQAAVEALLAAHDDAQPTQVSTRAAVPPERATEGDAPRPAQTASARHAGRGSSGRRVGPYRLVAPLGRGGMGTVYRAERVDGQFQQIVALKLIRRGLDTDDVLTRFAFERQVLAGLDHPNIARLYDGGVTEDGRPYFAMEYVEGLPITDYCDRHRLSTPERLRLFRTVCRAVRHAHRNLVVHRDLKPSNILVAAPSGTHAEDDAPQVKLLDFGIAKLLSDEAVGAGLGGAGVAIPRTRTGRRLLTPEYAAPEQIRGAPITTATDVYQLGVLLYELLTGRRPYRIQSRVHQEIERILLEEEPERPSQAVGRTADEGRDAAQTTPAPEAISRARRTDPGRLQRQLSGDLDVICLKALQKEPGRRYADVDALDADVGRHLSGVPVTARPDTFGYRASRFVRRHRVAVLAGVLVLVSLCGGLGATLWQARVAAAERDRAQAEAEKATHVNAFLQEVLSAADPYEEAQAATVRDALDAASRRVGTDLAEQPEVEAAVRRTIGIAYQNLSAYDAAESHLQAALDLRRAALGPRHEAVAQSVKDLALLRNSQGAYAAADSLYRVALSMHRVRASGPSRDLAEALNDYGTLLIEQGAYADAEVHVREALGLYRVLLGSEHVDVATALNNWAMTRDGQGDVAGADSLYRQSLAMQRRLLGERHPVTAKSLNNYAFVLLAQGDIAGAEDHFRRSLDVRQHLLGENHPDVALAHHNVGSILYMQARYDEAVPHSQAAVDILRRSMAAHPARANYLVRLADIHGARAAWADANAAYREALDVPGLPLAQQVDVGLRWSDVLREQGRSAEAAAVLRPLYTSMREAAAPDSARLVHLQDRLMALDRR